MRNNLMKKIRRQHHYGLLLREAESLGITDIEFNAPTGKGHPKMIVRHNGRKFTQPVPTSPHGHGDQKYLAIRLRKWFHEGQA